MHCRAVAGLAGLVLLAACKRPSGPKAAGRPDSGTVDSGTGEPPTNDTGTDDSGSPDTGDPTIEGPFQGDLDVLEGPQGTTPGAGLGHRVSAAAGTLWASAPGASTVHGWPVAPLPTAETPPSVTWQGPAGSTFGIGLAAAEDHTLAIGGRHPDTGDALLWTVAPTAPSATFIVEDALQVDGPGDGMAALSWDGGWALGLPQAADRAGEVHLITSTGDGVAVFLGRTGELAGTSLASAGDVNGDGFEDLVIGGWADSGYRGRATLVLGPMGGERVLDDEDLQYTGEDTWDVRGWSVAGADVNGDGYSDLAIGAFGTDRPGLSAGEVAIWTGPDAITRVGALLGPEADARAGFAVEPLGDLTGDGRHTLAIGGTGVDGSLGAVWIWTGPVEGEIDLATAEAIARGKPGWGGLGARIAAVQTASGPALLFGLPDAWDEAGGLALSTANTP